MQTTEPIEQSPDAIDPPLDQSKQQKWLERSMVACLLLTAMYIVGLNITDPDLWGHVQYGRDVIHDGIIHPTTTYSFTADGYRWINHENLSELLMATLVDTFGIYGLLVWKAVTALFVFLAIFWIGIKQRLTPCIAGVFVILVAANLDFHWTFRPQLLTFFFFSIMMLVLHVSFDGWTEYYLKRPEELNDNEHEQQHRFNTRRIRLLWVMPLVLCLWANSHGGFVAGVCIYLAYLFGRTVEAFYYRGWMASGMARRFALMGFCGVLGTLINPYGKDLHMWLARSLGEPRPEITDWISVELTSANGIRLLIAVAVAFISIVGAKNKRDWTKIGIMVLVMWQAFEHIRHVALFALLFGFWIPPYLASFLERITARFKKKDPKPFSKNMLRVMQTVHVIALIVLLTMVGQRTTDIHVDKDEYPVDAFQYMADMDLNGRTVVTYNWAQYFIGAFGGQYENLPHCPVAFDGRFRTCYPQEVVDMHFDFLMGDNGARFRSPNSPPIDEKAVLEHGTPELVLITNGYRSSGVMGRNVDNWILLYEDPVAQIWGRKSRFGDETSPDFIPEAKRVKTEKMPVGTVSWPAFPTQAKRSKNHSPLPAKS